MNTNTTTACFFCTRTGSACKSCTARRERAEALRAELAAVRAAAAARAAQEYFFDSWGALWVTCDPCEPGAEAFGPKWTARPASEAEVAFWWESLYDAAGGPFIGTSLYEETKEWHHLGEDGWTYLR